jgi:hypothetical protein
VTWTWDLGRTTARTSGITNRYGRRTDPPHHLEPHLGNRVDKAHVQSYSLNRYAYELQPQLAGRELGDPILGRPPSIPRVPLH